MNKKFFSFKTSVGRILFIIGTIILIPFGILILMVSWAFINGNVGMF